MKETREEIRARLLHDDNVIRTIQMRAYEIWQIRGRYDGRAQEDWMLAENEVLSFLLEQEARKAAETAATPEVGTAEVVVVDEAIVSEPVIEEAPVAVLSEIETAPEPKPRKRAAKATTEKTAKAAKSSAGKAAPKKTASRKKAASAEGEATVKDENETTSEAEKRTTTKKTTTRKSAK